MVYFLKFLILKVVDQGVQLNRILRLLEQDEMALYKRCNLYESKGRRHSRASFHNPFDSGLERSAAALQRHKLFQVIKIFFS